MKLLIAKSPWEVYDDPLARTVQRIVAAGYDAIEVDAFNRPEPVDVVRGVLRDAGLPVIVQIGGRGRTPAEQINTLEQRYIHGLAFDPLFFNSHTGVDHFGFDDNLRIFRRCAELEQRYGVPIVHETHRGRAMFSVPATLQYLRSMPGLRLTADLSHWFCVHESDLSDQEAALDEVLPRVDHVHARVGFGEGPQVSDPRNPLHAAHLARSCELWRRVVRHAAARDRLMLTMTPEFGPVPYTPLCGREPSPVSDPWEINLWMRDRLRQEFGLDVDPPLGLEAGVVS